MQPSRKQEREILGLVDRLIELAMEASVRAGPEREQIINQGALVVQELYQLVLPFLEGRAELTAEMLRQLLSQKLPDRRVLASFGDFKPILEGILETGLAPASPEGKASVSGGPAAEVHDDVTAGAPGPAESEMMGASEEDEPLAVAAGEVEEYQAGTSSRETIPVAPLLASLRRVFPAEQVVEHHPLPGTYLQYYLPGRQLAVEEERPAGPAEERKAFFCRQAGISLVKIPEEAASNWRQVARLIRYAVPGAR